MSIKIVGSNLKKTHTKRNKNNLLPFCGDESSRVIPILTKFLEWSGEEEFPLTSGTNPFVKNCIRTKFDFSWNTKVTKTYPPWIQWTNLNTRARHYQQVRG